MNSIADDTRKPLDPSGIRFGTPAITTRGLKEIECEEVARLMIETMKNKDNIDRKKQIREEIRIIAEKFPIPDDFITSTIN